MLLLSLSHALSDTELHMFTGALASMHIPRNTYVIMHAKTAINRQNILGIYDRFHFSCKGASKTDIAIVAILRV